MSEVCFVFASAVEKDANKVINKYHLQNLTNRSINDLCEIIKKDLGFF